MPVFFIRLFSDEENMKYELIQEEPAPLFYYDRSVPIELLLVTR